MNGGNLSKSWAHRIILWLNKNQCKLTLPDAAVLSDSQVLLHRASSWRLLCKYCSVPAILKSVVLESSYLLVLSHSLVSSLSDILFYGHINATSSFLTFDLDFINRTPALKWSHSPWLRTNRSELAVQKIPVDFTLFLYITTNLLSVSSSLRIGAILNDSCLCVTLNLVTVWKRYKCISV